MRHGAGSCLLFGQSDLRELRISVRYPWQGSVIDLRAQAEQRISDDDSCVIRAYVGEARTINHVARGINAAARSLQVLIDLYSPVVMLDPCRLQSESGSSWPASRGDEEVRPGDLHGLVRFFHREADFPPPRAPTLTSAFSRMAIPSAARLSVATARRRVRDRPSASPCRVREWSRPHRDAGRPGPSAPRNLATRSRSFLT